MTRSFLHVICRILIGAVLFAQLAVSAYVCPRLSAAGRPMATTPPATMDCDDMAGSMDPSSANLCAEHCRQGHQSDQAATLTLPAALLTALYRLPLAPEPPVLSPRQAAEEISALAAASPPHAILHCCFRT
jgi:hypothetical protein